MMRFIKWDKNGSVWHGFRVWNRGQFRDYGLIAINRWPGRFSVFVWKFVIHF